MARYKVYMMMMMMVFMFLMLFNVLRVHSPDGSTFLREMASWPSS